jgi:transcriptional regulator with GAF, ATPase, and Fis domain
LFFHENQVHSRKNLKKSAAWKGKRGWNAKDFLDGIPMNESASKHHSRPGPSETKSLQPLPQREASPGNNSLDGSLDALQRLINECTTRFMTMSVEQLDSEIRVSIQRIVEFLGLDRGYLCLFTDNGRRIAFLHYYDTSGNKQAEGPREASCTPWILQKMNSMECVTISQVADLPEEAQEDSTYFRSMGIQSHLSIPLVIDGEVIGFMSMDSARTEFVWQDSRVRTLMPVAHAFALSVERKRKKLEVIERIRLETLFSNISARLISVDAVEVDEEINHAFEMIGQHLGADRCGLLELKEEGKSVIVTHAWYKEGAERISDATNLAHLFPWSYERLFTHGEHVKFSRLADLPVDADRDRETFTAMGVRSSLSIPLSIRGNIRHVLAFNSMAAERSWSEEYIPRLRLFGEVLINALTRKQADEELRRSYREIRELKDKLQVEADFLRSEIKSCISREEIIGQSAALRKVMTQVQQVAQTDTTVLICGETGTGKELIAEAIHDTSLYRDKLMVKVNCASLPATLVESELFGREKGAYTGALTRQIGRFEMADGSTIFLDEIAELSLELQAKLLRVLQESTFERLGSPKTIQVNIRVIAATNRNIFEEVKKGNFREDLYYRLNVFPITVPPLRERSEDIPMLVWAFVNEFCKKMGKQLFKIPKRDMEALQRYSWPGNIRELRNIIEHAVIVSNDGTLQVKLPQEAGKESDWAKTLEEVESGHIMEVLRHTGGRIKGEGGAAGILGMIPSTLNSRMKKLGIRLRNEKGEISS